MATVSIRKVDLRGGFELGKVNEIVPRATVDVVKALDSVSQIIEDVATRGADAITDLTLKFDGIDPNPIRVSQTEIDEAVANLAPQLRLAIETAITRVRKVSRANLPQATEVTLADGAVVHQRWQPVDSVGLYVPGGKAVYPSSVIMNVVPAQEAKVARLALCSPAQKAFGGRPHPTVLATAGLLGVTEVYSMGGPAAVAAFACGLPQVGMARVQMVTGPGNIYVTAAKRALRGRIGIDSEAGTTEILILADDSADARLVAYDLISQAEHDEAAASVLVTDSEALAAQVENELKQLANQTQHAERVVTALNGQQSAIVITADWASAVAFSNEYATEHLEIQSRDNKGTLQAITNAGAIFLGSYSPVSLGDYMAGSSHVLPTGQQAKFGSGLGVHSFLRAQQIIDYNETGLAEIADLVANFADAEGLPAHGEAITARFNR
ncbi:MAG: histidinol dehydrogenase [Micrococcales bacterium]